MEEEGLYHYQGSKSLLHGLNDREKINKVSQFINDCIKSKNLSIFIGSGCSTPDVPLMGSTMKGILDNNIKISKIVKKYTDQDEISGFSDIEGLLNWIQNGIFYERNNDEKAKLDMLFDEIKKEFLKNIPRYGNEKYKQSETLKNYMVLYHKLFSIREITSNKLSVFTTNYDLFNEIALDFNNIACCTGFSTGIHQFFDVNYFKYRYVDDTERYKDRWQPAKKEANLYKLHGSVNWTQNEEGDLCTCNDACDNIIIYPTQLKHQETTQSPYSELFREFSNSLQRPNSTLLVLGYGFPDNHINNIMSQNLKNKDFNLIIFGNRAENNLETFYKNFNQNNNIHIIGGNVLGQQAHYLSFILDNFLSYEEIENRGD